MSITQFTFTLNMFHNSIKSCDGLELISKSPLPRTPDSMFHVHTCKSDEFVYFNLKRNFITQLPETYLVILAPAENGIVSKLFGSNDNNKMAAKTSEKKFRPFFNDAQFGWNTLNSSQILLHYYNRRVRKFESLNKRPKSGNRRLIAGLSAKTITNLDRRKSW